MARNLKTLGLALVVASAIGVVAASAASAVTHKFHSDGEKTYLTAEALGEYVIKATPEDNQSIKCNKYSISSAIEGKTLESITIKPTFSECTYKSGETEGSAFIESTSCSVLLTGETKETAVTPGKLHASAHLKCDVAGDHAHTKVTALKLKCRTIPTQEGTGLRYVTTETGGVKDIKIESTVHNGITTTENSVACPTKNGGTEVHNDGTIIGSVTIKGFQDEARTIPTSIWAE